jgi:hypothetical protein
MHRNARKWPFLVLSLPTETQQKYWVRRGINYGEAGLVSLADMIGGNSEPLTIDDLRAL